ncbi:hypothetical protein EFA46_015995 (plasmid) [Halarchaeum sp. CBA1220]|uniref:hypothetical protein n=1 Tax=Halarchaeum sp. CBA1220 TaxID=1853682 RepID=UPI001313FA6F|nr:hypothetical protein [Halarchaeum sp. CBA1220]QLC35759.1 hypothetical protein EFA46_015995 [Halarchaeum sp. CBA1220]
MTHSETRVPTSIDTRDNVLRPLKHEDETWDEMLRRLADEVDVNHFGAADTEG